MVSYLLLATIQVLAINCPWVAALGWKFPPTVKVDLHKGSKEIKHAIELGHDPLEAAVDGITMGCTLHVLMSQTSPSYPNQRLIMKSLDSAG